MFCRLLSRSVYRSGVRRPKSADRLTGSFSASRSPLTWNRQESPRARQRHTPVVGCRDDADSSRPTRVEAEPSRALASWKTLSACHGIASDHRLATELAQLSNPSSPRSSGELATKPWASIRAHSRDSKALLAPSQTATSQPVSE